MDREIPQHIHVVLKQPKIDSLDHREESIYGLLWSHGPSGQLMRKGVFSSDAVCRWLPIPTLTARTLGQFRVVFGLALFYVVFTDPPSAQSLEMHRNYSWLADWSLVHAVAASATACRVLHGITTRKTGSSRRGRLPRRGAAAGGHRPSRWGLSTV